MLQTPKRVAFKETRHEEEAPSLLFRTPKGQTSCKLILKKKVSTPFRSTTSDDKENTHPISEIFASPVQVKKRASRRRIKKSNDSNPTCAQSVSLDSSSSQSSSGHHEIITIVSEEEKDPSPLTPTQQKQTFQSPKPPTRLNDSIFDTKPPTSHRYSHMKTPVTSRKQTIFSPALFSPFNSVAPLLNSVYSKKISKSNVKKLKPKIRYGITEEELIKHYTVSELRDYCLTHSEKKHVGLSKKELVEKVMKILEPTSQMFILTSPRIADIKRKQRDSELLTENEQVMADAIERLEDDSSSEDHEIGDDMTCRTLVTPSSRGSTVKMESNLYSQFYNLGLRSISSMRSYCLENNINATGNRDTLKRRIILHLSKTQAKD
ncbi:hypothetical protein FDP41_009006 [Naegleria fowleri]|uniref:SAP domain-containing protein n=1 Tax=Naegleria fowleri TaxID=5763 RepID=A0A6A5B414_NAEFO|nr:uncharacterized protein FDP41_009006 [Naegleria fowleri]KAF0972757.1 hypothetical protein FDP41_009006 [Naegleria fowleri]